MIFFSTDNKEEKALGSMTFGGGLAQTQLISIHPKISKASSNKSLAKQAQTRTMWTQARRYASGIYYSLHPPYLDAYFLRSYLFPILEPILSKRHCPCGDR